MVERFNYFLACIFFLVLALSVKDLLLISPSSAEKTTSEPVVQPESNLDFQVHESEADNELDNFDSNFNEEEAPKKIPSLKMKSNQQTIKFLYW